MKKILCSLMSFVLAIIMVFSLPISVFAAEKGNTLKTAPVLTQKQKNTLNEWVTYDEEVKQFLIKEGAKNALTPSEFELLDKSLTTTNSNIALADFSSGEVSVVSPEDESKVSLVVTRASYNEGVTKIEFHWWGATIYLSKSTINLIGAGVTVAGIWIPAGLVSSLLATLGVVIGLCPGGIAFDYNFIVAGIAILSPGMILAPFATSNVRRQ